MDFLPKTANLQGGDTRKTPNLANHGVRQEGKTPPTPNPQNQHITPNPQNPPDGKTPPHANPSKSTKSRRSLSILSNPNTLWARKRRRTDGSA